VPMWQPARQPLLSGHMPAWTGGNEAVSHPDRLFQRSGRGPQLRNYDQQLAWHLPQD